MKVVRKIIPVDLLDIAGIEAWLEDMSRRGLHYVGCGSFFAHFQRRVPAEVRWHAEPAAASPRRLSGEQMAYSAQQGWPYAGKFGVFYLYWATDPETEAFHTDPVAQSFTLDRLSRTMTVSSLIFVAMIAALIAFMIWSAFDSAFGLVMRLVGASSFCTTFMVMVELFFIVHFAWTARGLRRLRRQLRDGVPAAHGRSWRRTGLARQIYTGLLMVAAVFSFLQLLPGRRWESELATLDRPAPILSLVELEGDPTYQPVAFHYPGYEGPDRDNYVSYQRNTLSRTYEVAQEGEVAGDDQPRRLTMDYYDLAIPALAAPLLRDLMDYHLWDMEYQPERYAVEELTAPGFDRLVLVRDVEYGGTQLFACAGDRVVYLDYSGEQDLAEHLDLVTEVLHWEG